MAVPLAVLLSVQFFLLFGAVCLKHTCEDVASWVDAVVPSSGGGALTRAQVAEVIGEAVAAFPLAASLVDPDVLASEEDGQTLGQALTAEMHAYLNAYVVRRTLWIVGATAVAALMIWFTMGVARGHGHGGGHPRAVSGRSRATTATRTGERARRSARRR